MDKRSLFKVLTIAIIYGFVAVSIGEVATATEKKTISLTIATATPGETYYPMGVAMASLWTIRLRNRYGIHIDAITSAGSRDNIKMIKGKDADLAILQGLFGNMAWNGKGIYKGKPYKELRTISMLWPNVEHMVLVKDRAETGTFRDIKGLRFSIGRGGSGAQRSGLTLMEGLGMARDDVKGVYLGRFESANAMKDKRIDGANLVGFPPVAAVTDIFTTPGMQVVVLEFTDEQLEQINEKTAYPGFRYTIPANTYPGQTNPVFTIAQPNFLGVRADVDKEVVYLLTKALFENPDYLKAVHTLGAFITLENALTALPAPLHLGAYTYYKEKGLTIPESLIPPEAR
ncbi:MAG: TAXI family TRAP transporter solute-binding subunit [Syntrophobacterales bacterium]|nr:MAG: TAXI family TRAP transporter solute-binding subunit [Syntrophobacterales bacterium]